jgi:hypothetical protein
MESMKIVGTNKNEYVRKCGDDTWRDVPGPNL